MFGMFKKKQKSDLEKLIEKDGIEYAAKRFSEIILQKIPTEEIAYQFVLEEIEAASQGNDTAISFARNSGISPQEYKGSMSSSRPEVDGPDGPQQFILALCMQLQPNVDLVVDLRTKIVDNVMKNFSFGKYEDQRSSPLKDGGMRLDEQLKSGFPTISLLNRLIGVGAEREFVRAVSAIWFVQAANDPNTKESGEIAGGIIGTLENFFVEEARALDVDVFKLFTDTIDKSEYGALFEETQPIYDAGRKEVNEKFPAGSTAVMEIYSHYANVMLKTTKQNKKNLLDTLQVLAQYVDKMCGLANQAEKDLF